MRLSRSQPLCLVLLLLARTVLFLVPRLGMLRRLTLPCLACLALR